MKDKWWRVKDEGWEGGGAGILLARGIISDKTRLCKAKTFFECKIIRTQNIMLCLCSYGTDTVNALQTYNHICDSKTGVVCVVE